MKKASSFLILLILLSSSSPLVLAKSEKAEDKANERAEQEHKEDEHEEEEKEDHGQEKKELPDFEISSIEEVEDESDDSYEVPKKRVRTEATKVKVEPQGQTFKIKTTSRFGDEDETELEEESELEIETESASESGKFKIKTHGVNLFIEQEKFSAKTNYPLSIDSETNKLYVTTPKGTRLVTVLPDQAIANMLRRGVLDIIDNDKDASDSATPTPEATNSASPSPTTESTFSAIPLEEEPSIQLVLDDNDDLVYKIVGQKNKKFFGVLPIKIEKEVIISAETGEVISQDAIGFFGQFLDWLSTTAN